GTGGLLHARAVGGDHADRARFAHRLVAVAQAIGLEIGPGILRAGAAERAVVDTVGLGWYDAAAGIGRLEERHQAEVGLDELPRVAGVGLQLGAETGQ